MFIHVRLSVAVLMCVHLVTAAILKPGQQPQGRIFGATEVDITAAPWTASVHFKYDSEMKFHCGGSILNQKFVATTSVVFLTSWNYEFYVRVGSSSYSEGGQMIEVKEFFCREDARRNDSNVGLFLLAEDIQFGAAAYPIPLPFKDQPVPYGSKCSITGWGYSKQGEMTGNIGKLTTDIWTDQEKCKAYSFDNAYSLNIFCAGGINGDNTCFQDAGDPLVVDGVLVGITTYPYGCKNFTSSYLKVSSQVDWIVSIVERFYYRNPGTISNNLADVYNIERHSYSDTKDIIQSCNVYSMFEKK